MTKPSSLTKITVPDAVSGIIRQLAKAGFEAFAVGGCVRDALLGKTPKDWDVATNATPGEIQRVFPKSVYENRFGTVGVWQDRNLYEVTTYRTEGAYGDSRHPDEVRFVTRLEDDLSRRDFTVNAMALKLPDKGPVDIIDPYGGRKDLRDRLVRAVGDPDERFSEDALRLMRAVRFAAQLEFSIDPATRKAITKHADRLKSVSGERIRDELMKIMTAEEPDRGIRMLHELGLLGQFLPELLEGEAVDQPKHHKYPVLEHNIRSLKHTPSDDPLVRLASLLHDVGKPQSARGSGTERTFHGHEVIGARMTRKILQRLRFSKSDTERVVNLVRHHMFLFQFETTDKAVRRIIRRVGPENIKDLVALRVGDRLGSGCKIGYTRKLETFEERVVEVQKDPIDTRMLAINGHDLMKDLKIPPGPAIGRIMDQLLEEVLDDPARNTVEYLSERAKAIHNEAASGK